MSTVFPMRELRSVPNKPNKTWQRPTVAEFFAGIGLVRMGLEQAGFQVVWSNDIEPSKRDMYVHHFGETPGHEFVCRSITEVEATDIPSGLSLYWASFPCTDLSLAGGRKGLAGKSSSTFWEFTRILGELSAGSRPEVVALENVTGFATSHGGADITAAIRKLNELGYSVDVMAIDARRFVPQSRPRLFLVGALNPPVEEDEKISDLRPAWLSHVFDNPELRTHRARLDEPLPPLLERGLADVVERIPFDDSRWWDAERTQKFLDSLSPLQDQRLRSLQKERRLSYRTAYRRTRNGVPTWEVRSDEVAGCLRTARGGSSKQAVVEAGGGDIRIRWMTGLEYARLMGAGDYHIDGLRASQVLFGFGDAVCVPVVAWLAKNYLIRLLQGDFAEKTPVSNEQTLKQDCLWSVREMEAV